MSPDNQNNDEETYVCTQSTLAEELKQSQDDIILKLEGFDRCLDAFKSSQDRMFKLIEGLENQLEKQNQETKRELKKGYAKFKKFDKYITEKKYTNGYRDKAILDIQSAEEKLKDELDKKASKEELSGEAKTLEEKIDLIVKNSEAQKAAQNDLVQAQKDFNSTFWKVLTIFFIVIGGIVSVLGIILRV